MKARINIKSSSNQLLIVLISVIATYVITFFLLTGSIADKPVKPQSIRYVIDSASYDLNVVSADSIILKSQLSSNVQPPITITGSLFNRNPVFLVWVQLILIMMCIAAGSFVVYVYQGQEIKKNFGLSNSLVVRIVCCTLLLCLLIAGIPRLSNLLYIPDKVIRDFHILFTSYKVPGIIVAVTLFLITPIMAVIFMILPAAEHIKTGSTKDEIQSNIAQIESLNKILTGALQTLAVIIVFSVLTASTLREAIKATINILYFDIFPKQESYVYGIYFSSFLGMIYTPANLFLKKRAMDLKKEVAAKRSHIEGLDDKTIKDIDDLTGTNTTVLDNLKLTFTVLAPLITSFLPELLKLK